MEQIIVKILTGIATKLLTEKILISLALNGIAAIVSKTDTKRDDLILADFAETLGRDDIAAELRKEK
jgi:hypothetical protein